MTGTQSPTQVRADAQRLRWLEPSAVAAVWAREWTLYRRYWRSTSFAALVEPLVYLLAFGVGFGSLLAFVGDVPYIEFLGTGIVASAVLFTSVFSGMFTTFVRRVFQRTYDALLAAPVDVHELVLAEASWIAVKAGVYGCAPLLAAMLFGLEPSAGMLLVPIIGFVTGFGFALFGILMSGIVPSIDSFNYVTSGIVTPLFLVSGTFFPLETAPPWMQTVALVNPLFHCVTLVRDAVFGTWAAVDLVHVGVLVAFAALMAWLAVRQMRIRLID